MGTCTNTPIPCWSPTSTNKNVKDNVRMGMVGCLSIFQPLRRPKLVNSITAILSSHLEANDPDEDAGASPCSLCPIPEALLPAATVFLRLPSKLSSYALTILRIWCYEVPLAGLVLWRGVLRKVEANMKSFATIILLFIFIAQSDCAKLTSTEEEVASPAERNKGPKVVSLLNNTPYSAEMKLALSEQGFVVKSMPSQQRVMELQDQTRIAIATDDEATTQWGITLEYKYIGPCANRKFSIYHFTLMLIDMTNNQVVMVLLQDGSDGPCTDIKPVFDTLAESLSNYW